MKRNRAVSCRAVPCRDFEVTIVRMVTTNHIVMDTIRKPLKFSIEWYPIGLGVTILTIVTPKIKPGTGTFH